MAASSTRHIEPLLPSGVVAQPKVRLSGSFLVKPLKLRAAGSFATKPLKLRVSGAFVDA